MEDYVNFETAKLLRQKGFDADNFFSFYNEEGKIGDISQFNKASSVLCPTLAMVCKWLRLNHNLHILAYIYHNKVWKYEIEDLQDASSEYDKEGFATYEEAVEEAIIFCLTNLIK